MFVPDVLDALRAADVPTPAYVYDLARVRENHARLTAALPENTHLYYSLKANPHPDLVSALRTAGARAEVCSSGELAAALAAGCRPDTVLYTGPGKRDVDLAAALHAGVRQFSVDSPHGLDQLDRLAGEAGVVATALLRVNDDRPVRGQGLAMTGVASQFGADAGWVLAEPAGFGARRHVRVTGLHLYTGSNLTGVEDLLGQFRQSLGTARRIADALRPHGAALEVLDLGGGFGAPFARRGELSDLTGLRPGLEAALDEHVPGWRAGHPVVAFESGRYLTATAGTLLTGVLDVKRSHGRQVVVLDAGINHLGGNSGLRRLPPLLPDLVTTGTAESTVDTMVTGPLCTPLDCWAPSVPLPPIRPGDVLAVPNTGAYGLSASLVAFLGHPLPAEVVLDPATPGAPLSVSRLELRRLPSPSHRTDKE